jgi:hypothetical protein
MTRVSVQTHTGVIDTRNRRASGGSLGLNAEAIVRTGHDVVKNVDVGHSDVARNGSN